MNAQITLDGCDDTTYIEIDLSESELLLLRKIADLSDPEGRSHCQPTLGVRVLPS